MASRAHSQAQTRLFRIAVLTLPGYPCPGTSREIPFLKIAALIVAAGRGSRAGGDVPKQYAIVSGQPVLTHTLTIFLGAPLIDLVRVVIHPDDNGHYERAVAMISGKLLNPVAGGPTRQTSVLAGLEALAAEDPDLVLIHDAARPLVDATTISGVISALATHAGAIAGTPVSDTLKRAGKSRTISETVSREGLWRAQTPQGFHFQKILDAHRKAAAQGISDFTDDAAIAEWAGMTVALVEGSIRNIKITTAADVVQLDGEMRNLTAMESRTATGFDVHAFTDGDHVCLGGIKIPHTHKLEGHSDADVVLHALTDALLGCIGDGDIGQHFPPSDPKWRGAASHLFLSDAAKRVAARGGKIVNVDVTILAEAPKVGPHRGAMQSAIGAILALAPGRIGIKATTTEGLGFTGRREGIAAFATATVLLPANDARMPRQNR